MKSQVTQLWDQPLAIAPSHIEDALFSEAPNAKNGSGNSLWPLENHNGACIIPVRGILHHNLGILMSMFFVSYDHIRSQLLSAIREPSIKKIVFNIDSAGGTVAGLLDLTDEIYEAREKKPIYAIVNESCFSAAYCLASAADRVFLPRTASLGSIGVSILHRENSGQNEKMGIKYTAIFAGKYKNDFSPYYPLSDSAKEAARCRVEELHDLICTTIARNRGMVVDKVKNAEAAVFAGQTAVDAGFADAVFSFNDALTRITTANGVLTAKSSPIVPVADTARGNDNALVRDAMRLAGIVSSSDPVYSSNPLVECARKRAQMHSSR